MKKLTSKRGGGPSRSNCTLNRKPKTLGDKPHARKLTAGIPHLGYCVACRNQGDVLDDGLGFLCGLTWILDQAAWTTAELREIVTMNCQVSMRDEEMSLEQADLDYVALNR